jgi:bifunctional UDP-N-acetylglucosamine pyrophosphorylase/glucosamine-1-phosphate N-acetyltransferase
MTAAGSVVTKNVPDGALAVGRARQKNLAGRSGGLRAQASRMTGKTTDETDDETYEDSREET